MKKKLLLLFAFSIYLATYGQRRYHRLEKLGNTLNAAQTNFCGNSSSGQLKLNIKDIPTRFSVGTVLLINANESFDGYYVVEFSRDTSNQDADETISLSETNVINIDCTPRDSDNDGVADSQDLCPTTAGDPANNGCPGTPDLAINLTKSSYSVSGCSSNCSSTFNRTTSSPPLISLNSKILINLNLSNTGNGSLRNESSIEVKTYASTNNTLEIGPRKDVELNSKKIFNVNLSPNQNIGFSQISVNHLALISANRLNFFSNRLESGYLIFSITKNANETNESNNTFALKFLLSYDQSSKELQFKDGQITPKNYQLSIYNISGQLIFDKKVEHKAAENEIINALPKGFYIVKSLGNSKKILK
jgi:hypothetical protein